MPASLQQTLDFLRDLREHNSREWFMRSRQRYDAARAAFEAFINELLARLSEFEDFGPITAAEAMYRIHRDVRFSPDKSPYKIHMGALLGKDGRKTTGKAYYVQIQPDHQSLVAAGLYMLPPEHLETVRRAVDADSRPLRAILEAESFKRYFGKMVGEQLKTAPKGYPKDHPDIDLLRYKQFLAEHWLSDEQVVADDLVDYVIEICRALSPFAEYCAEVLKDTPMPEARR